VLDHVQGILCRVDGDHRAAKPLQVKNQIRPEATASLRHKNAKPEIWLEGFYFRNGFHHDFSFPSGLCSQRPGASR
jgi:predicted NAD/FAD-binding protein